ncbi:nuclear transport factor 2 family protein [Oleiharenicola lentus]|uniref:Nuclear transport factor 2 family protein n=1 Tax=Oleiharenicola lentus TaxID=2508720 RepID=A0A4Q1C5Q2_9BACT|nr:nuclear transport factor 2 family protein [Oleiharenicola lentus]RXK53751.1 nuclear transport factor 2 family protein [Oleiharenicola lentus]
MIRPTLPRCLAWLFVLTAALLARADDSAILAAVRAADDERVAAIKAADAARLDAIFSDDLLYTHSNGKLDRKAAYVGALVSGKTVYEIYDYQQRDFHVASPAIVLMTARMTIKAKSASGALASDLSVLAVWRNESGKWRFLAWQSAKLAPPAAK